MRTAKKRKKQQKQRWRRWLNKSKSKKPNASQSWIQRVPIWARYALIIGMVCIGIPLAIAAMPALPVYAAFANTERSDFKLEEGKGLLLALAVLLLAICAMIASGATLWGTITTGQLCAGTRFGLHCTTFTKAPISFILAFAAFWFIFWVVVTALVAACRMLLRPQES
jgi:hypothetical protein